MMKYRADCQFYAQGISGDNKISHLCAMTTEECVIRKYTNAENCKYFVDYSAYRVELLKRVRLYLGRNNIK